VCPVEINSRLAENASRSEGFPLVPYFQMRCFMSNARLTAVLMIAVCALLLVSDNGARIRADEKPKKANVKVKDITLVVPAAWKQEKPSNRLRLAQFQVPAIKGDKTGAELVISSFGFGGGGAEANIARWVKQFQPQGRKQKITMGDCQHGKYIVVELSGTYNKPDGPPFLRKTKPVPGSRVVSVMLNVKDKGVYFLKLAGLDKTVAANTAALRKSFGGDAAKEKPFEL